MARLQPTGRQTLFITSFITIQVLLSIFGGVRFAFPAVSDTIDQGVTVDDVAVGGLSKEAAFTKLRTKLQTRLETTNLTAQLGNQQWKIPFTAFGARYDLVGAVEQAYRAGRSDTNFQRSIRRFENSRRRYEIDIQLIYDRAKLKAEVQKIARQINRPAVDAKILLVNDQFEVNPEQPGVTLAIEENLALLDKEIRTRELRPTPLVVQEVKPELAKSDLAEIKDTVAVFATAFNSRNTNRAHNISVSAKLLNYSVVKPGQVFSFNGKIGPRVPKSGYLEAPVISNNKLVQGVGGGVCQVSTTLYNAVLRCGLQIVKRSPHSKPAAYVPLGQDATVADNSLDFQFKNTRSSSILVLADVRGDQLLVRIYGKRESVEPKITLQSGAIKEIQPKVVIQDDPNLFTGDNKVIDSGHNGFKVKTYRVWSSDGKPPKLEQLSNDYYKPAPTIIRVGTKPRSVEFKK